MNRDDAVRQLQDDAAPFDVLIVGGGATGLGAAVDAARRGHRVALVEQADFAAGTSGVSTKLVHGGVRYLRQGDFGLVRSALRERALLLRNAPHLSQVLAFVIPRYAWWEGAWYRTGLGLYDRLAGRWSLGRSRLLPPAETLRQLPGLAARGLRGGVCYLDGQFDDARLALALAATAVDHGAVLANYCRCTGLVREGGRVAGARLRDEESGREFVVRAGVVVNATGVFVDTLRAFDEPASRPLVAASQGVHLVLPRRFLGGPAALMVPSTSDGRVLFAIPWRDRVVVGTTDTPGVQPSLAPRPQAREIEFILSHARRYLSGAPSEADILSVFTGLRPLVAAGAGPTASLSRDHTILVSDGGLITVTGGKWTTYRKMAEEVVDRAEEVAGLTHRPCFTEDLPLHGADGAVGFEDTPLAPYGSEAAGIRALASARPELAALLHPRLPYLRAEVVWQARQEMARTVEDVLARRTRALVLDAVAAIGAAPVVARLLAAELGRDSRWIREQEQRFRGQASRWLLPGTRIADFPELPTGPAEAPTP